MFTDIEGFTSLSERLAPAEVASDPERLPRHRGAGDPAPWRRRQQLHRRRPVRQLQPAAAAARTMPPPPFRPRSRSSRPWPARPSRRTSTCAPASASTPGTVIGVTIGAENRLNYTLLGDAVNIASRVEQLNKQFGTGDPRDRKHDTRRRRGWRAACGWARPTCAATRTTSWSIASGRRHDARRAGRDRRDPPALSLDGDVDLLPRSRDHRDIHGRRRVVVNLLALRRHRRGAAAGRQLADRPLAVRADPALPRRRASFEDVAAPPHPAAPAHRPRRRRPGLRRRRRSGCRRPSGSIRPSSCCPSRRSPTSSRPASC